MKIIPYSTSKHVFAHPAFLDNDVCWCLLRRMGLGKSVSGHLQFECDPVLAVSITAIHVAGRSRAASL